MPSQDSSFDTGGNMSLDHLFNPATQNAVTLQRQRAARNFDLHSEPSLAKWHDFRRVNVYPQDPFVKEPVLRNIPASELLPGAVNDRFRVRDLRGIAEPDARGDYIFPPSDHRFDQINVLYYATLTLRMCEQYAGRPLPWSFGMGHLILDPFAGNTQANAFYNERDQVVGFFNFRIKRKEIHAAQSADIVAHEVGHAILDGLRDLLNVSFSFGPEAFHEAFCDMMAILVALHDNGLIEHVLNLSDGNLRIPTFLPSLADELGEAQHAGGDPRSDHVFYLRSALNNFKAQAFDKLPYLPADRATQLGREAHSYSRVYTGVMYDILVRIYEHLNKREKWSQAAALGLARDIVGELLIRSVELGPVGESGLEDFAACLLAADHIFMAGKYETIIAAELIRRRLLTRDQADEAVARLQKLPKVQLPAGVLDAALALKHLEDNRAALGLPADVIFETQCGYRDRAGNRFITYFTVHELKLDGPQYAAYAGRIVPMFGGLTTLYSASGQLIHVLYRPVTEEDIHQANTQIADMITHSHLAFGVSEGAEERRAFVTYGADIAPTRKIFNLIDPKFIQLPFKKQKVIAGEVPPEVIRVSMQVTGQPTMLDHVTAWMDKLGLSLPKKKAKSRRGKG